MRLRTGISGPPRKVQGRQGHSKPRMPPMRSPGKDTPIIPKAPKGLSARNLALWRNYWRSELGLAADPATDLPPLYRLFKLHQERDGLQEIYEKLEPSQKLAKKSIARLLRLIDTDTLKLEDRFGFSPVARLRLGITGMKATIP